MLKCKEECGTLFEDGFEIYLTVEFVYYHAADNKTKAYTVDVDLSLLVFDRSEQLEKFAFVFLFNADTFVDNK